MNHLWFGKSLKEAIAAPVVFVDSENTAKFEPGFDKVTHEIHFIYESITSGFLHLELHLLSLPPGCDRGSAGSGTQTGNCQTFLQRGQRRGEAGRLHLRRVGRQEAGQARRLLRSSHMFYLLVGSYCFSNTSTVNISVSYANM